MGSIRTNRKPPTVIVNDGDGGGGNIVPPTISELVDNVYRSQTDEVIPAGKIKAVITNQGNQELDGQPGAMAQITVNNRTIHVGTSIPFESYYDRVTNEDKRTPQITVTNPDGATVLIITTE